jgi:hypothetical protein
MANSRRLITLGLLAGAIAAVGLSHPPQWGATLGRWLAMASAPSPADGPNFLVVAGGGAPSYNEIALEKNVLYFQRTLAFMGLDQAPTDIFFANGDSGEATIRYIDEQGQEQFKVPDIPNLTGAATLRNVRRWLQAPPEQPAGTSDCPTFFYFTRSWSAQSPRLGQQYPDSLGRVPGVGATTGGLARSMASGKTLCDDDGPVLFGGFCQFDLRGGRS